MKRTLKWAGIVVSGLVGLILILAITLFLIGRNRLNNAPEVATAPVEVMDDAASVENGRHLATISSCTVCHGAQLEGTAFVDEAPIGFIPAPNLTSGAGGVGDNYTDADWERAIRHGVNADGEVMVIMSSNHYASYGDEDLADLIAYLNAAPPVDNELGERQIQFMGNIIFGVLAFDSWSVNQIDHAAVGGEAPEIGETAEYGKYLIDIASCGSCHAENLAGNYGQLDSPPGPNLTTWPQNWSGAEFATVLRTGVLPDGRLMSTEMPWPGYAGMSDTEIEAIWAYLNTIDPLPNNSAE
ncbi:c-type cytochrome [Candidatus Leptofilum sp.]|uniref:c-type cytochrome n=1 Tax=Candidatus Leptofilum sp. TaxID=3241576 RepID=UPI003B59ACB0